MRCEEIQARLVSYIFNELNNDDERIIKDHINLCEKCRSELNGYRQTVDALHHWKDPTPDHLPVLAILPQVTTKNKITPSEKYKMKTLVGYGLRLAFVAAFAAALIFGTHIQYKEGTLSISIGKIEPQSLSPDSSKIVEVLERAQRQNLQLISEMIMSSETRQMDLYRSDLKAFSHQIHDEQLAYMRYITDHLYHLQEQNQIAYYQARTALDGLIKLTTQVK